MKPNQLKFVIIPFFAVILTFIFSLYISNPLMCEAGLYSDTYTDNLFFKIEQKSKGIWDVVFKNVNVYYQVEESSLNHDTLNNFLLKEVNPNLSVSELVSHNRVNNSVIDAVMEHFNDIQRGNFHSHNANHINSNSHGRGIAIASYNDGMNSPLDQFSIMSLLIFNVANNIKFTITNMGVYITISAYLVSAWNLISTNLKKTTSNLWSSSQESIYATIHGIVINQINAVRGQKYFPFIYTIFIFILVSNLIGMIPYNFSSTSHFILTFFISFTVVLGSTILGIDTHKSQFFSVLVPSGCPLGLLPLLVLIELISYLARNVSLGLRLAANVLSGHMLLNILSGFAYTIIKLGPKYIILGAIPLVFIIAFSALEIAICFIQAQVFSVLSSSYIKDGIVLH